MFKIDIFRDTVEKRPDRSGDLPQQESAILRANMRYFGNCAGASAKKNDCEAAIQGALNRYFKVDIAE